MFDGDLRWRWILDFTLWIPDFRFSIPDFLLMELGFGIPVVCGIPNSLNLIPDS